MAKFNIFYNNDFRNKVYTYEADSKIDAARQYIEDTYPANEDSSLLEAHQAVGVRGRGFAWGNEIITPLEAD